MRHPQTGGVQRFADAAVSAWRAEGWEPCDPPAEPNLAIGGDHPALTAPEQPAPPVTTKTRRASATEEKE
ncbi:hypothetical protein GCM10027280_45340 [Micromonospora polyrhachis]